MKGDIMETQKNILTEENKHTDYIYMVSGSSLIISMNAELDHHLADEMRDVIDTVIEERGVRHIIFDFSRIGFMDSSGIGLIMGRYKKIYETGTISIAGANESIQRILLISGLHKLVDTYQDVGQAVSALTAVRKNGGKKQEGERQ
jgi:stage II sporulation protein AA (anti-sigma F factor antagonist)